MEQICDFFGRAKLYWKLILKSPRFVPFGGKLTQFGANLTTLGYTQIIESSFTHHQHRPFTLATRAACRHRINTLNNGCLKLMAIQSLYMILDFDMYWLKQISFGHFKCSEFNLASWIIGFIIIIGTSLPPPPPHPWEFSPVNLMLNFKWI